MTRFDVDVFPKVVGRGGERDRGPVPVEPVMVDPFLWYDCPGRQEPRRLDGILPRTVEDLETPGSRHLSSVPTRLFATPSHSCSRTIFWSCGGRGPDSTSGVGKILLYHHKVISLQQDALQEKTHYFYNGWIQVGGNPHPLIHRLETTPTL